MKIIFLEIDIKSIFLQSNKDFANVLFVFNEIVRINQNVIEINDTNRINKSFQNVINVKLE